MPKNQSSDIVLRFDGVTKAFGPVMALNGCSFEIRRGDIVGYIGRNGAGKTTTLRILATLLRPDAGYVEVMGLSARGGGIWEIRRSLGYMSDRQGLYPEMLVGEYLDYCAATYRIGRKVRGGLVRDILALTDLDGLRGSYVGQLSMGNRQRVALARALIHDPQVLLLDEPASGLDPGARVEFRDLLKTLRGLGKTILISSHILSELHDVCDRLLMLSAGRVIGSGGVDELLGSLSHRVVLELTFTDEGESLSARGWFERHRPEFWNLHGGECVGRCLRFAGVDDEEEIRLVLAELVGSGFRVVFCDRKAPSLEEYFLHKMGE